MANTLQGTNWLVVHQTSGSEGILSLNKDTTGTYLNADPSSSPTPIVWSEMWVGNYCALWVIFQTKIASNIVLIWGVQTTMSAGTGMSAYGNNTPADQSNTSFISEQLTLTLQTS